VAIKNEQNNFNEHFSSNKSYTNFGNMVSRILFNRNNSYKNTSGISSRNKKIKTKLEKEGGEKMKRFTIYEFAKLFFPATTVLALIILLIYYGGIILENPKTN